MNGGQPIAAKVPRLPQEPVDWPTRPAARFLRIETAGGGALLIFTTAALLLSSSPRGHANFEAWETSLGIRLGSRDFTRSLREWINDALTTLFFFLVALELKREAES